MIRCQGHRLPFSRPLEALIASEAAPAHLPATQIADLTGWTATTDKHTENRG